jgi:hypothetical protein
LDGELLRVFVLADLHVRVMAAVLQQDHRGDKRAGIGEDLDVVASGYFRVHLPSSIAQTLTGEPDEKGEAPRSWVSSGALLEPETGFSLRTLAPVSVAAHHGRDQGMPLGER